MLSSDTTSALQQPAPAGGWLLARVREQLRYLHDSLRTEQAYVYWVHGCVRFHGMRHPREMGAVEVQQYLTWLSVERHVWVFTHPQALAALPA